MTLSDRERKEKYGKPQYFTGREPYAPLEFTKPLSPHAPSDGPRARKVAAALYKSQTGQALILDDYQIKLIDSILELYPETWPEEHLRGTLRWRQAIVSIPRRNGKSTIASVLATYSLTCSEAPNIGVLASTIEQAKVVFDDVKYNFNNHPALTARFKVTHHKGIESKNLAKPAHLKVHAGNGDSLQGITFRGFVSVIVDELHVTKAKAYDAAVKGASANPSAVVVGITTAGTADSELLIRLEKTGQNAIAEGQDYNPRFGFWHWTVPEGSELFDRKALLRANPAALADPPRIDIDQEILEGKSNPAGDYAEFRRYRRNEFIASKDIWLSLDVWAKGNGAGIPLDYKGPVIYAIDKTPNWTWATITAAAKIEDIVYTWRVARIPEPNTDFLVQLCNQLYNTTNTAVFVATNTALRDLIIKLREENGLPSEGLSEVQLSSATSMTTSLLTNGRLIHGTDPLIKKQLPKTVVKNTQEGVKISAQHSSGEIDAVRSTVMAVYQAEIMDVQDNNLIVF